MSRTERSGRSGTGGVEGFGGVFGDVVGDGRDGQRASGAGQVASVLDGPGVGLCAEPQRERRMAGSGVGGDGCGGGGVADGVAQHARGEERAGWLAGIAGCVEADDGVEVDDAAGLVFGDLDVTDRESVAELGEGESGEAGEVAGQVGGEPPPQVGCVGVEQDGGGVVVAVGTQRTAELAVVVGVAAGAGDVVAVRAAPCMRVAAGTAGQHRLAARAAGVDRA